MSRNNISILNILIVQHTELPVRILGMLRVLKLGNLTEDCHLLNQRLQGANVDGEAGIIGSGLDSGLLALAQFIDPDRNHLLQLGTGKEAERGVLASGFVASASDLLVKTITQGIAKIREIFLLRESA